MLKTSVLILFLLSITLQADITAAPSDFNGFWGYAPLPIKYSLQTSSASFVAPGLVELTTQQFPIQTQNFPYLNNYRNYLSQRGIDTNWHKYTC